MIFSVVISAVVTRLSSVSAVTSLLGDVPGAYQASAIYTDVPQVLKSESDIHFPFITVSMVSETPNDTKTHNGATALIDVHIWTRGNSTNARQQICDAVYDALQKYDDLSLPGATTIDCRFEGASDIKDPDGVTAHAILTFRVDFYLN